MSISKYIAQTIYYMVVIIAICSCTNGNESTQYNQFLHIRNEEFTKKDTLLFNIATNKSDEKDVFLQLRLTPEYTYENISLKYEITKKSDGEIFSKGKIEKRLKENDSNRIGSNNASSIKEMNVFLCRLHSLGLDTINIKIYHSMNTYVLYGIGDVGIQINDTKKHKQ